MSSTKFSLFIYYCDHWSYSFAQFSQQVVIESEVCSWSLWWLINHPPDLTFLNSTISIILFRRWKCMSHWLKMVMLKERTRSTRIWQMLKLIKRQDGDWKYSSCIGQLNFVQRVWQTTTKGLWEKIKNIYEAKSMFDKIFFRWQLYKFRMKEGSSLQQ